MTGEAPCVVRKKAKLDELMDQLATRSAQIKALLAESGLDPKRFHESCRRALSEDLDLLDAPPATCLQALLSCAADGLVPDGRKAVLTRYDEKTAGRSVVRYLPMYQGMLEVAYRSGNFQSIEAQAVYKGDVFDCDLGDRAFIRHSRPLESRLGEIVGAYAIARTVNGGVFREVAAREDLVRIRAVSRTPRSGPYVDWPGEMARKGALRRLWKWLPKTPAMERLIEHDNVNYDLGRVAPVLVIHKLHAGFEPLDSADGTERPAKAGSGARSRKPPQEPRQC